MISAELIRRMQQTVLKKMPLWRIEVSLTGIPQKPDGLMIYPTVVRVRVREDCCPSDDLEKSLRGWREHVAEVYGPERRQFLEAKRRLSGKLVELQQGDRPLVVVAAFDNRKGEFDQHNVWFLRLKDEEGASIWPSAPENCGTTVPYSVKEDGTIDFSEDRWDLRHYLLDQITLPAAESHTIVMSGRKRSSSSPINFELDGRHWTFTFDSDDIITDESLKAR